MRLELFVMGLTIAFFLFYSSYQQLALGVALLSFLIGILTPSEAETVVAKKSKGLEPIIVESEWGHEIKQMPKKMTILQKTVNYPPTQVTWRDQMTAGIPRGVGNALGRLLGGKKKEKESDTEKAIENLMKAMQKKGKEKKEEDED